jgi:Flp pilus assembly protein TadG
MLNLKKNQRGLAAIEMTLVVPFLLLLLFATAEFSRLLYQYNALTNVVRNATRYMSNHAINGSSNTVILTPLIEENTISILTFGDLNTALQILPNLKDASVSVATSADKFITLTVSYPWQPIFSSSLPKFFSSGSYDLSFPLVTSYTMRAIQ